MFFNLGRYLAIECLSGANYSIPTVFNRPRFWQHAEGSEEASYIPPSKDYCYGIHSMRHQPGQPAEGSEEASNIPAHRLYAPLARLRAHIVKASGLTYSEWSNDWLGGYGEEGAERTDRVNMGLWLEFERTY